MEKRKDKKYFVKYKDNDGKVVTGKFTALKAAREFARDVFRLGDFISLSNSKRILLPI